MTAPAVKDNWDRADIVFKALGSVLIPAAIACLAWFGNDYLERNQAREARDRLQTELMTKREESESALRKDMFKSILESFLAPRPKSLSDKMLQLEILTYNFYESFNLKPLFVNFNQDLDNRVKKLGRPTEEVRAYQARLRELARYIAEKQLAMLEQVGKKFDMTLELEELGRSSSVFAVPLNETILDLEGLQRHFTVEALKADRANRRVRVGVSVRQVRGGLTQRHEFWAETFDFPIIDNIRLSNDERFAVVLTSMEPDEGVANLTAVYFPGAYASLKEKPFLDEAMRRLLRR